MRFALVTGCNGLVGSATTKRLLELGYMVTGIDNNARASFFGEDGSTNSEMIEHPNFYFIKEDILNLTETNANLDVVVHCAAQPSHELANENPLLDFLVNVKGTLKMLEFVRTYSPKATFIHLSTTKVFSDEVNETNSEIDEYCLLEGHHGIFGANKLAADIIVQEYAYEYGMNTVVFRPGCITGKNHKGTRQHGFLSYMAKCFREDREYIIEGDGEQIRDQLHVEDLVDAFVEVINKPKSGVYVIGGGFENSISVNEAIEEFKKLTNKSIKISYTARRKADHNYSVHNNTRFKESYPTWEVKRNLNYILKDLL